MQEGVVVDLHEILERHAEQAAVRQQAVVVVRYAPRARVDVEAGVEFAVLGLAAEFGVGVAAAQAHGAAAGAGVVFQHLHPVAGLAQFVGGDHAGHARTEHQHRSAGRHAAQLRWARIGDSAARPRLLIAWYIAALPALRPIMRSNFRRVIGVALCIRHALGAWRWPAVAGNTAETERGGGPAAA